MVLVLRYLKEIEVETFHSIYYEQGRTDLRALMGMFRSPSETVKQTLSEIKKGSNPRFALPTRNMALKVRVGTLIEDEVPYKKIIHGTSSGKYLLAPIWTVFFLAHIAEERRKRLFLGNREEYFRILGLPYEMGDRGKKIFSVQSTPHGNLLKLDLLKEERPWKPDRLWLTVVPE